MTAVQRNQIMSDSKCSPEEACGHRAEASSQQLTTTNTHFHLADVFCHFPSLLSVCVAPSHPPSHPPPPSYFHELASPAPIHTVLLFHRPFSFHFLPFFSRLCLPLSLLSPVYGAAPPRLPACPPPPPFAPLACSCSVALELRLHSASLFQEEIV